MGLLELKTDLKSLKFGVPPASDRPGNGNSGQPYIKDPIDRNIVPQSTDFLLRGGLNAPLDAATDVVRLTKFFGDLKSPRGVLFVAKENLLSRIGAATQASGNQSTNNSWKNSPLNEGLYTPLSTIAQAGVGFTGAHLFKQGLNPLAGVRTYTDVKTKVIGEEDGTGNRLVNLYQTKINNLADDNVNILSYSGGPNSDLGIGKTDIKFASFDQRTGINSGKNFSVYQIGLKNSGTDRTTLPQFYSPLTNIGVSTSYETLSPTFPPRLFEDLNNDNDGKFGRDFITSVYKPNPNNQEGQSLKNSDRVNDNNTLTWNQNRIDQQPNENDSKNSTATIKEDFRKPLIDNSVDPNFSTIMSISPSYKPKEGKTKAIDGVNGSRINYTSPGQKGNIISYTAGKIVNGRVSTVDKINAQPIYQSKQVSNDNNVKNDLVKFRIAALNNENPNLKQYIHFRAYIDNFSDAYSANWNEEKYLGRGESFWKYGGFARSISLGFTVAAQSKPELIAQYKKLNFLASNLAPTYSPSGYMGGPLVQLTLGGWCYELPGFITNMTLDVPTESPWEISINDTVADGKGTGDSSVKEMPHIVKVTGFSFTPIHTFRPEKQVNTFEGVSKDKNDNEISPKDREGNINGYGPQRYIALANGNSKSKNNYDS